MGDLAVATVCSARIFSHVPSIFHVAGGTTANLSSRGGECGEKRSIFSPVAEELLSTSGQSIGDLATLVDVGKDSAGVAGAGDYLVRFMFVVGTIGRYARQRQSNIWS